MGFPKRGQTDDRQTELFGGFAERAPVYTPKLEHVLNRLVEMLAAMRAAEAWPWDEAQLDLYRNYVWPHLLEQLPEPHAARWTVDLAAEAARLDAEQPA